MPDVVKQIQEIAAFQNATINKIVCNKKVKTVYFSILVDKKYTQAELHAVEKILQSTVPTGFTSVVDVQKSIADVQLITNAILAFVAKHTLLSFFIKQEDVTVQILQDRVQCTLFCTHSEYTYLQNNNSILDKLKAELQSQFCNTFIIECQQNADKKNIVPIVQEEEVEIEENKIRKFAIEAFESIDSNNIDKQATYIEDCTFVAENLTICGTILEIRQCLTKTEKEYLRLSIQDSSGILHTNYFFKKATKDKVQQLQVGDSVVCTGKMDYFNNGLSFTTQQINKGKIPKNFVPIVKKGRAAAANYKVVHPEKVVDYNQLDLFTKEMLPKDFVENTFVVFDIETTGLINDPLTGKMDAVTEIGAVKIVGAEIVEKFTVLIDPQRKLEAKIIELTGITDEMLVGQPTIDKVVGDFYKFCHGAILVAHNINFDYKFMKYYCEQENFILDNKRIDTVAFAQEMLLLSNYKLNTIANHFNITFNHHRAYDDALTTAKIFIELVKQKKGLPNY